jgi:hypothetical protein
MKKKIEITKCLFPSKDGNLTGIEQPEIKDMQCITTSVVKIDGKHYQQFEYIPQNLNLCCGGNAKRKGNFIHLLEDAVS